MHEDLHAEAAADIAGPHAQLALADLQDHVGHHRPDDADALGGDPEGRAVVLGIVLADGAARLHRVYDQAIVHDLQLHHAIGLGESRFGPGAVAHLPVEDQVALDVIVDQRGAGLGRFVGADRVRPGFVVDLDQLRGILGLLQGLGDDQGDRIADVTDAALCQHRTRRVGARSAVAVVDRDEAGQIAVAGLLDVVAGQDQQDARRLAGRSGVDALDIGVGVRRAQHIGPGGRRRKLGVVGVAAAAGQKPRILDPAYRLSDAELCHDFLRLDRRLASGGEAWLEHIPLQHSLPGESTPGRQMKRGVSLREHAPITGLGRGYILFGVMATIST